MTGHRLYGHGRPSLLSLIRIAGDVRRGDVTDINQIGVYVRFVAPGVQHQGRQLGTGMEEGRFVHHFPAGGVDENGTGPHLGEERIVGHIAGGPVQRDVHGDDVRFLKELVQFYEPFWAFLSGTGRIVEQDLEAQRTGHILHFSAYIAHADDANHSVVQLDGPAGRDSIKGREDIIRHPSGVAAFCVLHLDAVGLTPGQVDMIHADGGTGDELHAGALQAGFVALGTGADNQGIGILHGSPVDGPSVQVHHLRVGFQDPFQEGNIGICNNSHI